MDVKYLQNIKHIICHEMCHDGVLSAAILHRCFPNAAIHMVGYHALDTIPSYPNAIWCDCAPAESRVQEFVDAETLVLDHHKSARSVVAQFGDRGVFADENAEPGVSGAALAYREVWKALGIQDPLGVAGTYASLVGVYDTWQRQDPRWEEAEKLCRSLTFYPLGDWLIDGLFEPTLKPLREERERVGDLLQQQHEMQVKIALKQVKWSKLPSGKKLAVIPYSTEIINSVADQLEDAAMVAGFTFVRITGDDLKLKFSFRTRNEYDILGLATSLGGGGHSGAAGAVLSVNMNAAPFKILEDIVSEYDRSIGVVSTDGTQSE